MTAKGRGRVAGLIYLGVVLTGLFTLAYAPGRLIVGGDPQATAAAMTANAALFAAANWAALAMCAFFLALPFALSRFLAQYGSIAAMLMILLVAASLPPTLLAVAENFRLAQLAASGGLSIESVDAGLAAYKRWMGVASVFWGLWLAPLAWLILKSGAIPRLFGVLLVLGCIEYVGDYFGPEIFDGYRALPFRPLLSAASAAGEIGTCLWLLVMGARSGKG